MIQAMTTTPVTARRKPSPRASLARQSDDRQPGRPGTLLPPPPRWEAMLRLPGNDATPGRSSRLSSRSAVPGGKSGAAKRQSPKDVSDDGVQDAGAFGRLTLKQQRFVLSYARCGNATRAAIDAGYSAKTASQIGYENLRKHEIREVLGEALERAGVTDVELDIRLCAMLNANMADFEPLLFGKKTLAQLQDEGIDTRNLRRFRILRPTKNGGTEGGFLEIVDPLACIALLMKLRGLPGKRRDVNVSETKRIELDNQRFADLCDRTLQRLTEPNVGEDPYSQRSAFQTAPGASSSGRPPLLPALKVLPALPAKP